LAAFLAQRDGWYRKHVYVPFHAPLLIVPQIKTGNGELFDAGAAPGDAGGAGNLSPAAPCASC
jgi:hypothetical protein